MSHANSVNAFETTALRHRFCVAPMMDCTDRHCRYFLRLISRHALLYTEMITAQAILHGDTERLLAFDEAEHPVALQLGGSEPGDMARCARIAEEFGYDEVNINVGCPSSRVQLGRIGACLMQEPETVARCVSEMRAAVNIPVTVKTRIGVDESDSYEFLQQFVQAIADAGCETVIVHARKAWLKGMDPKQNRTLPPLHYERVHHLKQDFPALELVLNGGISTIADAYQHLSTLDGVMLGREAYRNPYSLHDVDRLFFADSRQPRSRTGVVHDFLPYVDRQLTAGVPLQQITRHLMGLFLGQPGGRRWRRSLGENTRERGAGVSAITSALEQLLPSQWSGTPQLCAPGNASRATPGNDAIDGVKTPELSSTQAA